MRKINLSIILSLSVGLVHAQSNLEKVSTRLESKDHKENYINLTREKLSLEVENKKLKELNAVSEERIKDLNQGQKQLEKDLAAVEKELSASDRKNTQLEEQNTQLKEAIGKIRQALKAIP